MKRIVFLLFPLLIFSQLNAQNLEDYFSSYTGENGSGFMMPFANAFGANLNSGFYHSAKIPTNGINVYFGVITMTAFIADDAKTFQAKTGEFFNPSTTVEAPTIFGSTEGSSVDGISGTSFSFPGGLSLSKLPLVVPQLTIGSVMGTDATIRFISLNVDNNIGELNVFGIGLRHSISQYLPLVPVDISAGIYYQSFDVGDLVKANSTFLSLQGSYALPIVTFYGGLGYETSSMDIKYQSGNNSDEEIEFNLNSENNIRLTLGAALKLAVLLLNVDYNIGNQNVLVLGLGFEF